MQKTFIINEVGNAIKIAIIFVFLYEISPCWLVLKMWNSVKQEWTIYCEQSPSKITNQSCYKGRKYCKWQN